MVYQLDKAKENLPRRGLFKHTTLAACIMALTSTPSFAQEDAADLEEVIVTGTRANLQNAQDIKRDSDTFVDAISAEDIGSLPDRSVLEAIQRLPGVSVERFAGPDDPDHFSTEGSGALVRGLTQTRSELNGRDSFSANNGRGLSFNDISPELMGGVDVYKNQTADMIEGGIGGTINLRTRKPFDSSDRVVAFTVDASYGDMAESWTPSFSGLYSDRWETSAGEFGALISFASSKLKSEAHGVQADAYVLYDAAVLPGAEAFVGEDGDGQVYVANGSNLTEQAFDREREGLSVALQWANDDDTLMTTFEYIRSKSGLAWTERANRYSGGYYDADANTETRNSRPLDGTKFEFDERGIFQRGTILDGNTVWRTGDSNLDRIPIGEADWTSNSLKQIGQKITSETRYKDETDVIDDFSFTVKWNPSDALEVDWGMQYINATREDDDVVAHLETRATQELDYTSGTPSIKITDPWHGVRDADRAADGGTYEDGYPGFSGDELGDANYFQDPTSYFLRSAMDHYERSEGEAYSSNLDATYEFENAGPITSVKAGLRYAKRDQINRLTDWNWGSLGDAGGDRGVWLDETAELADAYEVVSMDSFYGGDKGVADIQGNGFIYLTEDFVKDMILADSLPPRNAGSDWVPYHMRSEALDSQYGIFTPGEIYNTVEENKAAYVRFDFGFDDLSMPISGNIGLRYVEIDRQAIGSVLYPDLRPANERLDVDGEPLTDLPDDMSLPLEANAVWDWVVDNAGGDDSVAISEFLERSELDEGDEDYVDLNWLNDANSWLGDEERAFGDNYEALNTQNSTYSTVLPSLNIKMDIRDDLIARFAVSKAIAQPSMDQIRNSRSIGATATLIRPRLEDVETTTIIDPDTDEPYKNEEGGDAQFPVNPADLLPRGASLGPGYTSSGGNPLLKPMESIQYDISLEWYFSDEVGQLTGTYFHKDLKNFFVYGAIPINYTHPTSGVTRSVEVTSNRNEGEGTLDGIELAYQQYFSFLPEGWDGLGVQASYTYIDASGVPNNEVPADEGDFVGDWTDTGARINLESVPLQGQSDETVNFTLMYDKYNWSARIAYNWRSEYLLTTRDVISKYPLYNESGARIDASVFYTLMDNYTLGVQVTNLTDVESKTTAVINNNGDRTGRSWFTEDRRVALVFKANF